MSRLSRLSQDKGDFPRARPGGKATTPRKLKSLLRANIRLVREQGKDQGGRILLDRPDE